MKTTNTLYKGEVSISLIKQINYPLLKSFLSDVSCLYPEFESWLHFKVRRFDRDIVIAHDGNQLAGVSILKILVQRERSAHFMWHLNSAVKC